MLNIKEFEAEIDRHYDIINARFHVFYTKYGKRDIWSLVGDQRFYKDLCAMTTELSSSHFFLIASMQISAGMYRGWLADPLRLTLIRLSDDDDFVGKVLDDVNDLLGRDYFERNWPLEDDDDDDDD